MKVLIVGAGMAGLALANILDKDKFQITLVDKALKFGTIGFAISVWNRGIKVLERLNLYKKLENKINIIKQDALFDDQMNYITNIDLEYLNLDYDMCVVSRADLHQALSDNLIETGKYKDNQINIQMSTNIKQIENSNSGVWITFNTDNREFFDIVIGADGVRSQVRDLAFGIFQDALVKMPYKLWSFWTEKSDNDVVAVLGQGHMSIEYPSGGRGVFTAISKINSNILELNSKYERVNFAFKKFGEMTRRRIAKVKEDDIFEDDMHYVNLKSFVSQRVVLIGDAAHALSPILGLGTTLAIEDGCILGDVLNSLTDTKHINNLLLSYNTSRSKYIKNFRFRILFLEKLYIGDNFIFKSFRNLYGKLFGVQLYESLLVKYLK